MLTQLPAPVRTIAVRHRELLKFAFVGASTFVIDTSLFYVLKWTVLAPKPVTAKVVAVLVATIVSYVLNREWAFRTRGGRERHHEASLYFLFSGIAVALYAAPLWISRYALHLQTPYTTRFVEEIADFTSGQILGVLLGMAFRWWAFRKWVFPADNGDRGSVGESEAPEGDEPRPTSGHPRREPFGGSAGAGAPTTRAEKLR